MENVRFIFRLLTPTQELVLRAYIEGKVSELSYRHRRYLRNLLSKLHYGHLEMAERHLKLLREAFYKRMGIVNDQ